MTAVLEGIRIVDFTRLMLGPVASQILGDFGAEVIKVESIGAGDGTRNLRVPAPDGEGFLLNGESPIFLACNRNKKSICVDLKADRGKEIVYKLVDTADVVMENFRPGVMDRLGFGYETLSARNPRLVYLSSSGYGQTGPYRYKKGQDLVAQAMGGITMATGVAGGPPVPVGTVAADVNGARMGAMGIMLALFARERTGMGQHVDVCLLNEQIEFQMQEACWYLNSGQLPDRGWRGKGNPTTSAATHGLFKTRDGYMMIGGTLAAVCKVLGIRNLEEDPRYDERQKQLEHGEELRDIVENELSRRNTKEWLPLFEAADLLCAPVNTYRETFADPQVIHNRMVEVLDHPRAGKVEVIGIPIKLSRTPGRVQSPPPLLGQHTDEILASLGYSPQDIAELRCQKAVG